MVVFKQRIFSRLSGNPISGAPALFDHGFVSVARQAAVALLGSSVLFCAAPAQATEEAAKALAQRAMGGKPVEAIRQLPNVALYEIWVNRTLVYTDLDAKVIFIGNLLDGSTLANLREQRISELMAVPFKDLPLEWAIKTVRGNGSNKIVVFSDPNCGFCKRFEAELKEVTDVTIYTVMYPVLGPDSRVKARAILCAAKPEKAWRAWMDEGKLPPAAADSCQPPLDAVLAFGKNHEIGITPTTFFENGKRLPGTMIALAVSSEMAAAKAKKP